MSILSRRPTHRCLLDKSLVPVIAVGSGGDSPIGGKASGSSVDPLLTPENGQLPTSSPLLEAEAARIEEVIGDLIDGLGEQYGENQAIKKLRLLAKGHRMRGVVLNAEQWTAFKVALLRECSKHECPAGADYDFKAMVAVWSKFACFVIKEWKNGLLYN